MIKYNFYRYKFGLILGLLSLLLVACGSDIGNVTANESVSEYYIEDEITPQLDNAVNEVVNKFVVYAQEVDSATKESPIDYAKINRLSSDYIVYLKSKDINPITEADYELYDAYVSFSVSTNFTADFYLDYSNSKDDTDRRIAKDSINDVMSDLDILTNVANKYGIN